MLDRDTAHRQTNPLDVVYLTLLVTTFAVAGSVILLLGPDSWIHRHPNTSFGLLFGALGVIGFINLSNANRQGKIWGKCGPVYRACQPWLFRTNYSINVVVVFACIVGVVALLFFLPPLK